MIVLEVLAYAWLVMAGVFACGAALTRPPQLGYWAPAFVLLVSSAAMFLIVHWIG